MSKFFKTPKRISKTLVVSFTALFVLGACSSNSASPSRPSVPRDESPPVLVSPQNPSGSSGPYVTDPTLKPTEKPSTRRVEVIAKNLDAPWSQVFLPNGDSLISQRDNGKVLLLSKGALQENIAFGSDNKGEGGLLGLAVSPFYEKDKLIFAYLSTAEDNRIMAFKIGEVLSPILTGIPKGSIHNGGRLAFGPDNFLYVGTGDTGDKSLAQDPNSLGGKILRMTIEGKKVPGDDSLVFSLGHRNVQGLAFDKDKKLWASEFGQNNFDEINQVNKGDNGGWPLVEGDANDKRFQRPFLTFKPKDASPSGIAIVGDDLYMATLKGERLYKVSLKTKKVTELFKNKFGRLRSVNAAPDGSLWVLTSNTDGRGSVKKGDDKLFKFTPR